MVSRISEPKVAYKAVTNAIHNPTLCAEHTAVRVRPPSPNQNTLDMRELILIRLQCLLHTLSSTFIRLGGYARRRGHHRLHSELHALLGLGWQTMEETEIVRLDRFMDERFKFGERRWERDIQGGYYGALLEPSVESCGVEV